VVVVFLSTIIGAYATVSLLSEKYEARTTLLVKLGQAVGRNPVFEREIDSIIKMLGSRILTEEVIDKIGVERFFAESEKPKTLFKLIKYHIKRAARWVKSQLNEFLILLNLRKRIGRRDQVILLVEKSLAINRAKKADVIEVRLRLPDPTLAVDVLRELTTLYMGYHLRIRRGPPFAEFFQARLGDYRKRIEKIETATEQLKRRSNLNSVADRRKLLLERLNATEQTLQRYATERALRGGATGGRTLSVVRAPDASSEALPATELHTDPGDADSVARQGDVSTLGGVAIEPIKKRLTQLRLDRIALLRDYEPGSTVLQSIDGELARVDALFGTAIATRIRYLQRDKNRIERQLSNLNTIEKELLNLKLEKTVAETNFKLYAKRSEETRITTQLDLKRIANVAVMSPPQASITPVSPKKLLIVGVSAPIGLLLGLGLAMLIEYLSDVVRSGRDLADFEGLTDLGTFDLRSSHAPLS